jgi:hypothetical protein
MGHDDRERKFEKALERHLRQGAPRDAGAAANSQWDNSSPACPDAALLAAFHERMLSNEEMDAAKQHIAACARCQETLALLEATDEVVFDAADAADDVERGKVVELAGPVLAGRYSQEEEYLPRAAEPSAAARATVASRAPLGGARCGHRRRAADLGDGARQADAPRELCDQSRSGTGETKGSSV